MASRRIEGDAPGFVASSTGHKRPKRAHWRTPCISTGFADLEYAMCFNCALAWHCPCGDARRLFGQGMPKEVWHRMEQTWTVVGVPTNARITEDTSGWE